MISGLIIAGIIYKVHPAFVTGYISLSLGALGSGYVTVTKTANYLIKL